MALWRDQHGNGFVDDSLTERQLELLVRLADYSDARSRKGIAPNVPLCGMCWKGRTNGRGLASCANSLDKLGLIRKWNTSGGFYTELTAAGWQILSRACR